MKEKNLKLTRETKKVMPRNQVNREPSKCKEEWSEQRCGKVDELFKVNKINCVYHKIQQFFGKRKQNCTNIRDKNNKLLVDEKR